MAILIIYKPTTKKKLKIQPTLVATPCSSLSTNSLDWSDPEKKRGDWATAWESSWQKHDQITIAQQSVSASSPHSAAYRGGKHERTTPKPKGTCARAITSDPGHQRSRWPRKASPCPTTRTSSTTFWLCSKKSRLCAVKMLPRGAQPGLPCKSKFGHWNFGVPSFPSACRRLCTCWLFVAPQKASVSVLPWRRSFWQRLWPLDLPWLHWPSALGTYLVINS